MTTEYHDDPEEDSTFWNQEPPGSFSRPFRIRRWMFPALTAAVVLILIIALGASSSATDGCCALNWDPFGKSCYFFSNVAMTWDEAQDWCTGHESHLVILSTDKEWDFVVKHSAGTWYWVGLTDRTGKWEWVNHTPYVMDRRRWRPGQPDSWTGHGLGHGDEDCGQLHSDGRLNDLHCLTQLRYICQKHS
eukprot:XP_011615129.1 PREDICTED: asialoglycoprotein receptor 2-like [Takifugu rubripes]